MQELGPKVDLGHIQFRTLTNVVACVKVSAAFWSRVSDRATAKRATWGLLQRLRWRPGGLIAKHINRPISLRITRALLDTPLTPNQTTWVSFLVGGIGVALIFFGGFSNLMIGMLLLQANNILDGIDGELARIRHQTSEYGAYLDSVFDEILNAGLMIGVGYHLSHYKYDNAPMYQALGIFGQFVYINPDTDLIVVMQSAFPSALAAEETRRASAFISAVEEAARR